MDRNERRRTGGVDRDARPAKIKQVGEAIGRDAQGIAGTRVSIDAIRIIQLNPAVVVVRDADKHAGLGAGEAFPHLSAIFQCLPGDLEQQALLRIHARGFTRRDAKEMRIELVHLLEEAAPSSAHFAWGLRIRIVKGRRG